MKTKELAPLIVDACIEYLRKKDIGTKYHPYKDTFLIDTWLMARILRHNGNLQAQIRQDESLLMNKFIKSLIDQKQISSVLTDNKYNIEEQKDRKRLSILVTKIHIIAFRGRKPKYIGEKNGIRDDNRIKANI